MPKPTTSREFQELSSQVWNEARWHDGRAAILSQDHEGGPIIGPGSPTDAERRDGVKFPDLAIAYSWDEIDQIMATTKVFGDPPYDAAALADLERKYRDD